MDLSICVQSSVQGAEATPGLTRCRPLRWLLGPPPAAPEPARSSPQPPPARLPGSRPELTLSQLPFLDQPENSPLPRSIEEGVVETDEVLLLGALRLLS